MFSIQDKVALVTGAVSGMGLHFVKALLKNGLRGVVIADVDCEKGEGVVNEITGEFAPKKAIFIKTNVSIKEEFEVAFKEAVKIFGNLDIVINNAGKVNDFELEKEIAVNMIGTIYGCILAWDYLPKFRSGDEGVVVNVSSIAGLTSFMSIPIYAATKHGVIGLSKSLGVQQHYDMSKIRVLTVCPGVTKTPLLSAFETKHCLTFCQPLFPDDLPRFPVQEPDVVAKGLIEAITTGTNGSFWIVNDSKIQNIPHLPEVFELPY